MTRKRFIQSRVPPYDLIPAEEYEAPRGPVAPYVVPDIQPYRSMVDGSIVGGRRQHREHLRAHGVVEVGNAFDKATPKAVTPPGGLKEKVIRAAHQHLR